MRIEPGNVQEVPVKGFLVLSRLPFLSPGLASLVASVCIALSQGYDPEWGLVGISFIGLAFIMLATYYFNEYFDFEGDAINRTFIKLSGGSRALIEKNVPRRIARVAGWSSVVILAVIAFAYLLLYFEDYPLLLPLALFGAFCGVFYSHPPFQWAYQGIGEVMIGGCYGVLTFVSGFYLTSGVFDLNMVVIAMPASLTIFCVIVANEFPDHDADKAVNKRNLVVRLGLRRGAQLYAVAMGLTYPFMLASWAVGISPWIAVIGLPVLLLCAYAINVAMKGGYAIREQQMRISSATLVANLLSSLLFIPAVLVW